MIIVDNALEKRAAEGRPVRVGVIGSGFMGRGLANQIINSVPGMRLVAVSNRSLDSARRPTSKRRGRTGRREHAERAPGCDGRR